MQKYSQNRNKMPKKGERGFQKGDADINRAGRPKGSGKNQMLDALLDMDKDFTRADIAKRIWAIVEDDGVEAKTKLTALGKLADFIFDKPTQSHNIIQEIELED